MYRFIQPCLSLTFIGLGLLTATAEEIPPVIEISLDIAPVWSGHTVGFALLTQPPHQYIAFYDDQRRMTVAYRKLDAADWHFVRLPETIGWDSHNYVTMTIDDEGYIHLSGNMHCVPLVYFRTARPYDVDSFQRIPGMVGDREQKCTYPRFLRGANNELLFTYRDGSSGNGDQLYNVYDLESQTWRRLLDQPLTSGEGKMNAYAHGPKRGPDGFFHLCWVWRDTPDCATNHDLSYARSRDLVHWETSGGESLNLPITLETGEIVDPVPAGGGIINGNTILGFDSQDRPVISYHKFDAQGYTQIYNARREKDGWKIYQTSQWEYRWEFKGGGSIPFEIRIGSICVEPEKRLSQSYRNPKRGSGRWLLDAATLKPVGEKSVKPSFPPALNRVKSQFPGMQVRRCGDSGKSGEPGVKYILQWETLGSNRDRPRKGDIPPPSMLKLYKVTKGMIMKKRRYGELAVEAPQHIAYSGSDFYIAATGVDMVRYVGASHRSDTTDYILEMFSRDNGQTWTEPKKIVKSWEEDGNLHTRATTSTFIDAERGITIQVGTETRQDKMVVISHLKYTRPIYRFSFDGGKTWTETKYLIQDGDEYNRDHYAEGIVYGTRMAAYPGTGMIKLASGKWLMPYQTAPLDESGKDFYNPHGAYGFFNTGVFIGTWNESGDDLIWEKGDELTIDADLSSRGLTEPGIVQLKDGRIVMTMRGSNSKIENQKGVKWVSVSEDEGRTWAAPWELAFDDGSTMYSPASMNKLIRHSNGKIYWSGNIVPKNPVGNMPRYPIQVAEFDEETLTIRKDTVQIVADKEEGDCNDIQFSNYGIYEDRVTHELVFTICALPEIDYKDWTGHLYLYRISVQK